MKLVLLGPPGSGKGTMAQRLVKDYSFHYIYPGKILREEIKSQTQLGKNIQKFVESGELVPTNLVVEIVKLEIGKGEHYILDGFPRSLEQVKWLGDDKVEIAILLDVPEEEVIKRFAGRRMDPVTGNTYNVDTAPPPEDIKNRVIQREDDKPQTVKLRFKVYREQTEPVANFYQEKGLLITVNGVGTPDEVYERVKKVIDQHS